MKEPRKIVTLPQPIPQQLPCTETALMQLCTALGVFEQNTPPEPHYRLVFFGSARRPDKDDPHYAAINRFAIAVGEHGIDGVSGGGPHSMEAFNSGIVEGRLRKGMPVRSYGVSISLYPDEKPNTFLEKEYRHGHYATRLHHFARLGKDRSFVAGPLAGIGTGLEVWWIWQLLQAKQLGGALCVLVGDMWPPLIDWVREFMVTRGTAKVSDLELVRPVRNFDEALPLVLEHHAQFKQHIAAA